LVCSMLFTLLHSTLSDLRQHILGITPGLGFSDHPTRQMHAVGTCSYHRPHMRVICRLLRSNSPFCAAFRLLLSAGFGGSEYRSRGDMSAPILVHFGPSPALALGYLR
jgi:membrane protease YdiL (CAAX protease family)